MGRISLRASRREQGICWFLRCFIAAVRFVACCCYRRCCVRNLAVRRRTGRMASLRVVAGCARALRHPSSRVSFRVDGKGTQHTYSFLLLERKLVLLLLLLVNPELPIAALSGVTSRCSREVMRCCGYTVKAGEVIDGDWCFAIVTIFPVFLVLLASIDYCCGVVCTLGGANEKNVCPLVCFV